MEETHGDPEENWRGLKERRLLSNIYVKQRIKVMIGEEMSAGRDIGKRGSVRLSSIACTLQQLLEDLVKNCFLNTGSVNIGGRRIKCIRFVDYIAWQAEVERMLKNMLVELNDRCEDYGKEINISKTKPGFRNKTKEDRHTN